MKNRDQGTRQRGSSQRKIALAIAAIGALFWMGIAAPAAADNFGRGFENELGRVLAREAVSAGKQVLFHGIFHPMAYGHSGGHGYGPSGPSEHYGYDDYDDDYDRRHRSHYRPVRRPTHTHHYGRRPVQHHHYHYAAPHRNHPGRGHAYGHYKGHKGHKGHKNCGYH